MNPKPKRLLKILDKQLRRPQAFRSTKVEAVHKARCGDVAMESGHKYKRDIDKR